MTAGHSVGFAWEHVPGMFKDFSIGFGVTLWGVDFKGATYYQKWGDAVSEEDIIDSAWDLIDGEMVNIDVGRDGSVWATDAEYKIYFRHGVTKINMKGDKWGDPVGGSAFSVATCTTGTTFVIGTDKFVYWRTGVTDDDFIGSGWHKLDDSSGFTQISCGGHGYLLGLKGVDGFYRAGVTSSLP